MKRLALAVAVVLAAALAIVATPVRAATPFRVVAVGDSICTHVCPAISAPGYHYDSEPGRGPYSVGAEDRASTVQALGVLSRTVANSSSNWIVVFDGGTYTNDGVYISNADWSNYLTDVLRLTAGKCLVFVMPAYSSSNQQGWSVAYARTVAALTVFGQNTHRCIYAVNWFAAANSNPSYLQADGLHPSPAGVAWIAGQINTILPDV